MYVPYVLQSLTGTHAISQGQLCRYAGRRLSRSSRAGHRVRIWHVLPHNSQETSSRSAEPAESAQRSRKGQGSTAPIPTARTIRTTRFRCCGEANRAPATLLPETPQHFGCCCEGCPTTSTCGRISTTYAYGALSTHPTRPRTHSSSHSAGAFAPWSSSSLGPSSRSNVG